MQRLPRAGRWTIYISLAVVFAVACALLSNWQFSRNQERAAQLALVAQNYDAAAVPLADVIPLGGELDPQDEWRPVVLTGSYLARDTLLARNRPHGGTSAFEVLVPFRLDDGRVLLVERGWVPPGYEGRYGLMGGGGQGNTKAPSRTWCPHLRGTRSPSSCDCARVNRCRRRGAPPPAARCPRSTSG